MREWEDERPCDNCGDWEPDCECPECPICGETGRPRCYDDHGLKWVEIPRKYRSAIRERLGLGEGDQEVKVSGLICPYCRAPEVVMPADCTEEDAHRQDRTFWMVRGFKVNNDSKCLACEKWFPESKVRSTMTVKLTMRAARERKP